jgi:hypothetical protein
MDDVKAAAKASEVSVAEAARNISEGMLKAQKKSSGSDD